MNLSSYHQSSGAALAHQLSVSYGIHQSEIQAKHVDSVYKEMPRINSVADFSATEGIFLGSHDVSAPSDAVFGVIVETREHQALETVIKNVIEQCGIRVQLFHGTANLDFILSSKIATLIESGKVVLTELNADQLKAQQYNALLLSKAFWNRLIGREKVLIFQTDSLCCSESNYTLDDFLTFDYIGASWHRNRPIGLIIDGGNGGFSLRDWRQSVDCLSRFQPRLWGGGEDGYYAFHMALIGAKVATQDESAKFATQDYFDDHSFGAHAIYNLNSSKQHAFFRYCELAKKVFPNLYATVKPLTLIDHKKSN